MGTGFLTYDDAIGKEQKVDIGGKTAQHQASSHQEATEDGDGPRSER